MLKEHDRVVLTCDLPGEGLEAGDVGTVVHVHRQGEAFEVEFMTLEGDTVVVAGPFNCRGTGAKCRYGSRA
jgi:hypothetical protein